MSAEELWYGRHTRVLKMNLLDEYGLTERFVNEAALYPEYQPARIIAQHREMYQIVTGQGISFAEISGRMRFETDELVMFPAVGDFVMVSSDGQDSNAVIHRVLPRKSLFIRTAVGVSGQAQCVAANIDTVFICMSLNQNFNLSRLERYLSVAWDSGATPVVILTKADLCEDLPQKTAQAAQVSLFADILPISVYDADVEEKLSGYLKKGTTSAFIGSSGVGKSTLINRLLGDEVTASGETGKDGKGRHTTSVREMFLSPFGGVLIDTPGMRELGAESIDLEKTFDDIEELVSRCKFRDCTHTSEPGCAVLSALEDGSLDMRRWQNYCKLKTEAGYDGLSAKEIEVRKAERMFKDVGGMKNVRKAAKEFNRRH